MELGGYGFEKSELLKIAEDIYALKSKKQDLELTLSSEKFHYKYIPKRKNLAKHEVLFRLLFIVPITIIVVATICFMIYSVFNSDIFVGNGPLGIVLLFATLTSVFGGYITVRLWMREIRMLALLWMSRNPEKAAAFSKKFNINTFQNDEENSRNRIEMLEAQIAHINQRVSKLEDEQKQLLENKKKEDEFLKEKGVLLDGNPKRIHTNGKISLREESIGMGDAHALHEFYLKEEQYTQNYLLQLEGNLQRINKQIVQIDEDFEQVKKMILFFIVGYVIMILIQGAFSGLFASFTAIICFIVSLSVIFALEKKCAMPVILYLLEHDSSLVQEYAFRNNMVPVHIKREELLEKMQYLQNELEDIKKRRRELVFD